jgi:dynein regulatory complex protein 1
VPAEVKVDPNGSVQHAAEDKEVDPNELNLDSNLITKALAKFYTEKEAMISHDMLMGTGRKKSKRSNFENEKEAEERKRKTEKIFWERLVSILSEQKLSVWRSLDKSMTKYYQLLVDRQNLIEETGLLNQQNEELKTLLN